MKVEIQGAPYPVAIVNLEANESVNCQKGAMTWMTSSMQMQTKTGGLGKMFGRAFTGESMFINQYTAAGAPGMIAFSSSIPGDIMVIDMAPGKEIVAQKSAFLASAPTVNQEVFFQKKIAGGFFGGEGFIMQKFSGSGTLMLEIDGSCVTYDLAPGEKLSVDTGNLAAMDATCTMNVETVKGIGNALFGGEGFFNTTVTGPGRVYLQTMPISTMAGAISRYIPSKS